MYYNYCTDKRQRVAWCIYHDMPFDPSSGITITISFCIFVYKPLGISTALYNDFQADSTVVYDQTFHSEVMGI